jgi:AAHS family 4-hydroxybenzoate transporter-like MFS transporter
MDKYGLTPMKIIAGISVPIVALLGVVGAISAPLLFAFEFFAGFCILSLQFGMIAISAMIYPTSYRSVGAGWAQAIGRVGSVIGPVVGGILIAVHFSVSRLYMLAAIPFLVATLVCVVLQRLLNKRFQGSGLAQAGHAGSQAAGK